MGLNNEKIVPIELPESPNCRLLLATTNVGKIREVRALLTGVPIELVGLADVPPVEAPVENGATFADNARLKATHYASVTGMLAVAKDSGQEVEALGGAPGVNSARYGGTQASYPDKFRLIYDELRAAGIPTSPARFVCALALADPSSVVFEARGIVEGRIAPEPRGDGGFGYDPIFYYPPYGC